MRRKLINNNRFSVRFCYVMTALGIKTVGQAEKFLAKVNANCSVQGVRMSYLQREMKEYLDV